MSYSHREQIISEYFNMWLTRCDDRLEEIFADDVVYVESTGNEYRGLHQIMNWFGEWFDNGVVKRWDITSFSHVDNKCFVEWHFECVCYNNPSAFDGVSIVEFDSTGKICFLREFAASCEHHLPYDN